MIVYGMALALSSHSLQLELDGGEKREEEDTRLDSLLFQASWVLYPTGVVQSWGSPVSPATGAVIRQCTFIDPAPMYMQLYSHKTKFNCIQ
jgi:hypothetical protein